MVPQESAKRRRVSAPARNLCVRWPGLPDRPLRRRALRTVDPVSAHAGPFDLGAGPCDCVVTRVGIGVDPYTPA